MVLKQPGLIESRPLSIEQLPDPELGQGDVLVEISVCGVCRTDLHVVEGELPPVRERVVPGHQVVGTVRARGPGARRFKEGDRVGVAWLHRSCGCCSYCRSGGENLCESPTFTGWHVDGGYAERVRVPEAFAYPIPETAMSYLDHASAR